MTHPRAWIGSPHEGWPAPYRLSRGTAYVVSDEPVSPRRPIGFRFDNAERRDEARPIQRVYELSR